MKGETILNAYTKAALFTYESDTFLLSRLIRADAQRGTFKAELIRRLAAYDAAMDARVAERFMSQAMASAVTDFDFFTAVVNRINLDAAKIAELELKRGEMRWHKDAARDTLRSLENADRIIAEKDAEIFRLQTIVGQWNPKNAYPPEASE